MKIWGSSTFPIATLLFFCIVILFFRFLLYGGKCMKTYIFGAGTRGKNFAQILNLHDIKFEGFIDTFKKGSVDVVEKDGSMTSFQIIPLSELENIKSGINVIVSPIEPQAAKDIRRNLSDLGIQAVSIGTLLYPHDDLVSQERNFIAEYHRVCMNNYFEHAEQDEAVGIFWNEGTEFLRMFRKLNLKNVLELACGRGRHVPHYIDKADSIMLVDILQENIDFCKNRFSSFPKVSYYANNGRDLHDLSDESYSAVFSYDAMVHFELLDIYSYLKEIYRVLISGGRALIHHSNLTQSYKQSFSNAPGGRNYMSRELFAYMAYRSGFEVIEQKEGIWNMACGGDCLSLIEKA